ncbi:MAG TPA: MlaD family protein [Pirellulales bacterium]|jgi:phospholipid/cholesterol/gamma-HCH transport system substrate-binding protein|nr:MlaD family protein [Pirellulales bacterium]
MDERVVQFRVGVTVLAALIITGILMLLFGEAPALLRGTYVVYIKFASAPGVSRDTPIEKSGIHIGKVTKVQFAPDNQVLITASIDGEIELYRDEAVQIKQSLLGDARLEFVPGPQKVTQRVRIQSGDLLAGMVATDPLQAFANIEGNLSRAAESLTVAGTEVGKLAKNLNDVLGNNRQQFAKIIEDTDQTMQLFQKSLRDINDVVGDEKLKRDLKQTIGEMPKLLGETRDTINGMQKTIALANDNLQNIQTVTKAMDEQGEGMITNIARSVEQLESLLTQFNKFSRALNSKEGSLGQLVNNPELYNNLSQAATNVNRLTRELEPIICNVNVITDKVARHPGVIVTDAISPGPGIK